ncbi:MAG: ferritin-like domain-containing protein [Longispora sp.]|nr:ferritin-like domain-containing protein [Longispora sp. (in: high G+C Gram-positive bacteria)]
MNAADRLVTALAAEHAAIYGYGVVGGRLTGSVLDASRQAEGTHRQRRDDLIIRLTGAGVTPPAAEPAYATPFIVTDQAGALRLAAVLEERTAQVWRSALPVTTGDDRALALAALVDAARRCARWRGAAGEELAVTPFPGKP